MEIDDAKGFAIKALLWLAKDNQNLEAFLMSSGANANDLRIRSKDPEFLSFILDFFMTSDKLVVSLSQDLNISPEEIQIARSVLSGGDLPHWT